MTLHYLSFPADHLCPIWRRIPTHNGICSMALDPREAKFVLERGWALLDGERWRVKIGWDGIVEGDGRVDVYLTKMDDEALEAVA